MTPYTLSSNVLEDGDVQYVATHPSGVYGVGFNPSGAYKAMLRALIRAENEDIERGE